MLPEHSYQWDKIIIYVAQIQFYFFVLLSKYITKQKVRDKAFNIEPSQAVRILACIWAVPGLNLDRGTDYID